MKPSSIIMALALLALLLLGAAGCDGKKKPGENGAAAGQPEDKERKAGGYITPKYPISFADRPFKKVHPSVDKAWLLVETAYFVIKDKYRNSSGAQRSAVEGEVEKNIFVVNDKVEALFKEAIKAEPENALNYAAYAVYLKPRKRVQPSGGFINTEQEALDQLDKAIEIWPDEWSFYLLKVWTRTWPHFCDDWYRGGNMEELAIAQQLPLMEADFQKAEQYFPNNAFINYYHAMVLVQFTDPGLIADVREKAMREIRAGNNKQTNLFFFPPPLRSFSNDASIPRLFGTETEPKYVDQWFQFGTWDYNAAHGMLEGLSKLMTWPEDKDDITALMYCAYGLGRTQPYDRSFFAWQQRLLDQCSSQVAPDSQDRLKLAEAGRYLTTIYMEQAGKLNTKGVIKDPSKLDVAGISIVESGASRLMNVQENLQAPQAAYLKRFGEIFGIKFPLPEDPGKW